MDDTARVDLRNCQTAEPRPVRLAAPQQSAEDTDHGWGEPPEPDPGERLRQERPPHWDDS